jgi:hypothetical protein
MVADDDVELQYNSKVFSCMLCLFCLFLFLSSVMQLKKDSIGYKYKMNSFYSTVKAQWY